jgi:hypothetical protein
VGPKPNKKSVAVARWTRLDELVPNMTLPLFAFSFRLPYPMEVFSLDKNLESDAASRTKAARRSRSTVWG